MFLVISSVFGSSLSLSLFLSVSLSTYLPQDDIRKTAEDRVKIEKERKKKETKEAVLSSQKSALDRFKK